MNIKHEVKSRLDYKRNYYDDDSLRSVEVSRADIEDLIDMKGIWATTQWMCKQKEHSCARYDFVCMAVGTKVAKLVLTGDEKKKIAEQSEIFKEKEREYLSEDTMQAIKKYVFRCWKIFEQYKMLEFTKVTYTKSFGRGRRRRTYRYKETAVKLTEKGLNVEL
ncbi:hypothetical protein [Bacillus cereus group sp. BfR-BA-00999]|uniref:hypothetical protein n=1 Tax=Bacillus cereus group sp. BfR-BA-00999 TaxID=3094871 RepID=UPI0029C19CDE|nr:hypothetical protein [Bacillus cereus group sp. BfR-BA-00999]MDX5885022.1 hypothetical protein [Bacillus cereus group sp. BfR-BA-00999]